MNRWIKYLLIFLPAIPFYNLVFRTAQNIPIMDDYDAVLGFLIQFKSAGFWDKITLLLSQHNEHRILYSRIVYVLYYWICGEIDFRNLIVIGDLQLIPIGAIAIYFIKKHISKGWEMLSIIWTLCLFNLDTYENATIAMYSMANYGLIFLFFLTLFVLSKQWMIIGMLLTTLMILSNGNGMIAAVFLCLYAWKEMNVRQSILITASSILGIVLYFFNYSFTATQSDDYSIGKVVEFFIRVCGAPFSFDLSLLYGV